MADFSIESLAEDALLLRFGDAIDPVVNARVHAAARALRAAALPGVVDIAPAYASLLLRIATMPDACALVARIRGILAGFAEPDHSAPVDAIDVPVCYADDFAPDLDAVAAHAGLSRNDVIARHSNADYSVAMLGFAPGFPYLLGLDPALHMPRRATPRTRVPPGSVAIGGAQTGIYPRELPGGWQIIGRTPLALFDAGREPPCLFAPGQCVRFRAIDADEYTRLAERRA